MCSVDLYSMSSTGKRLYLVCLFDSKEAALEEIRDNFEEFFSDIPKNLLPDFSTPKMVKEEDGAVFRYDTGLCIRFMEE